MRVAAYVYPGWHPIPERDASFHPGFTEWDLVRRAKPRFEGHRQPRVPLWGYEDESDPAVMAKKIDAAVAGENRFEEITKGKKEDELTAEEKTMREELSKKVVTLRDERDQRLREIGGGNRLVKQIIDLALLTNGMLKGKNLTDFIQRSISLIEK